MMVPAVDVLVIKVILATKINRNLKISFLPGKEILRSGNGWQILCCNWSTIYQIGFGNVCSVLRNSALKSEIS